MEKFGSGNVEDEEWKENKVGDEFCRAINASSGGIEGMFSMVMSGRHYRLSELPAC